jgi:hypothetical protein
MQRLKRIDKIREELKKNREEALTRNLQQQGKQRQLKGIDKNNVKGLKKRTERTITKARKSSQRQSKGRKRGRKDK